MRNHDDLLDYNGTSQWERHGYNSTQVIIQGNYKLYIRNNVTSILCQLNFFFIKILKCNKKKASTNFVFLSRSRNTIGRFMKTHLHRPIKTLQFLASGKIEKCLISKYFSISNIKDFLIWTKSFYNFFIYKLILF